MTQKITPFLWFDDNAEEAMNFYVSIFKNSEVLSVNRYGEAGPGQEGTVMTATFRLSGLEFMALNGGPQFKFTPAISFFVSCKNEQEVDGLWTNLSDGGIVLMGLGTYPFSDKFGWVMDKFGVSWQMSLAGVTQTIAPFLMFVGAQHGRAEEAMNFYVSLFKNSRIVQLERYGPGEEEPEGTVKHATFSLSGQEFMAIDSNREHPFTFTPAISLFITCDTQQEVDALWDRLSEGGATSQCGWLTDRFGVSWQVVPFVLGELLQDKDPVKSNRVMQAMLQMTKLDIATLERAYEQE
jgi:predicted 3-demethylubiquinone-9 3-methyltransferase (glyoxalase superfamily)